MTAGVIKGIDLRVLAVRVVGITAVSAALLAAAPAGHAADVGWCGTPEDLSALMRVEGQRPLAYGNQRIQWNPDREVGGVIFTADPEGRIGYVIRADKPMGTPATKSCIALRLHDVRLYDARTPEIPDETLVNSTVDVAERRCAELVRENIIAEGSCGFHNDDLAEGARVGEGVMLQGRRAAKQADGTYRTGSSLITVTFINAGNGTDKSGRRTPERDGRGTVALTALPEGASIIESVFIMGAYTEQALELLEAGKQGDQVSGLVQPR